MRKNQRVLWIVIAILAIPFVFYFSKSDLGAIGSNQFGTIYGRTVPRAEVQRNARLFQLARDLGMYNYLQDMVGNARSEEEAFTEFTWNRMIIRHEGERLGIRPAPHEVGNVVRDLPVFRSETGFDISKYNEFAQNTLPAMGFTEGDIEELAEDQVILKRLKQLVGFGVEMPEIEARENYTRVHGRNQVAVVRVRADQLAPDEPVTDEQISNFYEQRKASFTTDERRTIQFVSFALDEEQKKLTGKERIEALQKVADRATEFTQALAGSGKSFEQAAEQFGLAVQTTGAFTRNEPDPMLAGNPQLAQAAFSLSEDEPVSDPLQAGDSFYIIKLAGTETARPLTLDEARPKIVEQIKQDRQRQAASAKGTETVTKIREALKSGATVEQAFEQAGAALERIPAFALADPPPQPDPSKPQAPEDADLPMIKNAIAEMSPGETTEFIPTRTGGIIAVLESRTEPDVGAFDQMKSSFDARMRDARRNVAFQEWLKKRRDDAGVQAPAAEAVDFG